MSISLIVASPDLHFREMIRESLLNVANATLIAEFPEIALNLYIRVLHELERHPHAALILDLSGDTEGAIKALEKVRQADRKSTRLNSSHSAKSRMPSSA